VGDGSSWGASIARQRDAAIDVVVTSLIEEIPVTRHTETFEFVFYCSQMNVSLRRSWSMTNETRRGMGMSPLTKSSAATSRDLVRGGYKIGGQTRMQCNDAYCA
jgi:hypothetical protein